MSGYQTWLRQANFIAGQWVGADDGRSIDVTNPVNGAVIGTVPNAGEAETMRAIDAAEAAFPAFAQMPLMERLSLLWTLHDALMDNQADLAELLTVEMGKPLAEAKGEIAIGAQYVRWFAEEARRAKGEIVPAGVNGRRILVTRHPVGVVGMITPWNFPSSMLARKLAPALAVGCTVVAKPATATPYSGLAWAALAEEVGFPAGTVNILTGSARAIAGAMMARPEVRKITFTGSTEVGKELLRGAAETVKKVSMELGGNAPFIVFDDADLDAAVEGAMISKYRNMGQTCVCANRIYVQAGIHDAFVEKLAAATRALKVGDGLDDGVAQGPMVDMDAVEKVESLLSDATSKGAKIATGGKRHALGGQFFEPTVLTHATQEMAFAQEEIFGPLAPVFKFETEEEAIAMANDTVFGLASYAYTSDLARAFRLNEGLQYGMIGINSGLITTVEAPFGGVKESGMGKEGGSQGLDDYLDTKYVCIDGI
ncbi:aldehyde dehydrogenase family protein [Roseobacter sp. HKCCD9010]|uniref:NAD-dependent succinate-semialdehyde dehydrogenase n=1 Tax=unclassified Roseobacter TaxID=196798 RepID=UPI001492B229|nr:MULTISPECIES: NAD-dependent succinate-semialdehyde dehydrogenase [unclassified Roseobacter]MBF9048834.1 aldehyde dehydrogenase family protein [Rhodobacterales bacterium HKCCD4356]NNV10833.1 aldehyde dehydrogenase family protein [Roseobacter sp. HKCCD7357]NNV15018.1 aldehyde dehydrogenase family protein [Roseobacter sp. HKCCD8768]NNV24477.1 aldehyde dehydrogenase family protein [Roseobacter sp. HKCCD8192]NNV28734.1 aldehyde dehydrogenase family protein [Roseobacter sp. HKCCD9061]